MAAKLQEKVVKEAVKILKKEPDGVRFTALTTTICRALPGGNKASISTLVSQLPALAPDKIFKPSWGLFRLTPPQEKEGTVGVEKPARTRKITEDSFYQPFADWLMNELEECTRAIPLGGNYFKDKWGTPDVIGVSEPLKSDIVKVPAEIVSAEIKLDRTDLVTAFGQACAYKLFSHRSYLVVPREAQDVAKLDSLCRVLGIGLILFDDGSPEQPRFEIRVRALKHDPDMSYLNANMKIIEKKLFG